jgi:hypothetical protein
VEGRRYEPAAAGRAGRPFLLTPLLIYMAAPPSSSTGLRGPPPSPTLSPGIRLLDCGRGPGSLPSAWLRRCRRCEERRVVPATSSTTAPRSRQAFIRIGNRYTTVVSGLPAGSKKVATTCAKDLPSLPAAWTTPLVLTHDSPAANT